MARSLISKRRAVRAVCSKCHSPDYEMIDPTPDCKKPGFKCRSCGHYWQYGYTGGVYAELAQKSDKDVPDANT